MKHSLVLLWVMLLFGGISWIFWKNEIKYTLPTPVPKSYSPVHVGDEIILEGKLEVNKKPVFFHFFNPACPCSRFNIPHVRSLVKKYGNQIDFNIVVISKNTFTEKEIRDKFDLQVPVLFDENIAKACGVYSTPQAVILDANNTLYYRGNYNKSRYCTDKNSNYAQMAIDSLLNKSYQPSFSQYALKAYGCELPTCTK